MNVVALLEACLERDIVGAGALVEWGMVPRLGCLLRAAAATREGAGGPRNVDCFRPVLSLMSLLLSRVWDGGEGGSAPRGLIAGALLAPWATAVEDVQALLLDVEPGGHDTALEVCRLLRLLFEKCGAAVVSFAVANASSVMWCVA